MSKSKEQFIHNLKRTKRIKQHNRNIMKQFYRESDPGKKRELFIQLESEDYDSINNHIHHPYNY